MDWFDSPPCTTLEAIVESDDLIKLMGPSTGSRVVGGATAAFGGVFATVGAGFMRLPIPMPFKLIPLAFTAIGTGIAAVGTSAALAECTVEVKREQGITITWKLPLRDERAFHIPLDKFEAFEVTDHAHEHRDDYGSRVVMEYRLVAVTRRGSSIGLESFSTRTQARLRKEAFEKVLGRV